jgi:hypothetical protein
MGEKMNVKTLLSLMSKEVKPADRENAQIEFWCGDQEFEIESMHGFALSPDITIRLKKIMSPVLQPMRFKAEHGKMVAKKVKEISGRKI